MAGRRRWAPGIPGSGAMRPARSVWKGAHSAVVCGVVTGLCSCHHSSSRTFSSSPEQTWARKRPLPPPTPPLATAHPSQCVWPCRHSAKRCRVPRAPVRLRPVRSTSLGLVLQPVAAPPLHGHVVSCVWTAPFGSPVRAPGGGHGGCSCLWHVVTSALGAMWIQVFPSLGHRRVSGHSARMQHPRTSRSGQQLERCPPTCGGRGSDLPVT